MKRILLGVMTLMLVGCPAPSADQADKGTLDVVGNAALEIVPQFRDGGYKTLAEVKNYTRTDIQQLDLELIRLDKVGETWQLPATLDASNRKASSVEAPFESKTIRFASLRPNTTYRIRWYAYNATGTLTPASPNRISADGSRDVAVGVNDTVTVETLTIQLKDREFNSTATLDGIDVIDGGYTYPGAETIDVETK